MYSLLHSLVKVKTKTFQFPRHKNISFSPLWFELGLSRLRSLSKNVHYFPNIFGIVHNLPKHLQAWKTQYQIPGFFFFLPLKPHPSKPVWKVEKWVSGDWDLVTFVHKALSTCTWRMWPNQIKQKNKVNTSGVFALLNKQTWSYCMCTLTTWKNFT